MQAIAAGWVGGVLAPLIFPLEETLSDKFTCTTVFPLQKHQTLELLVIRKAFKNEMKWTCGR